MTECYFSSGICETLTCCKDGEFNDLGYPENQCPKYPCRKYLGIVRELEDSERKVCPEWS